MSWRDVHGWTDPCLESVYYEAVRGAPGDGLVSRFIEVGCAFGRSVCYMATRIAESGKAIRLLCVDTWPADFPEGRPQNPENDWFYEAFLHNIETHLSDEERSVITVCRRRSDRAAGILARESADFVFLDAAHDEESVTADIAAWLPVVRQGGTIAGHDFSEKFPGVEAAVRKAFGNNFERNGSVWMKAKHS